MIKVIEVKRNLTDLSLVGEDELNILLDSQEIAQEMRYSYHELSKILQSSVSTLNPIAETSKSILCRNLLTNDAAIPVILARGTKAASEDASNLYVRPSTRIKAIHAGKLVYISAEEPIIVKEVMVDSKYSGYPITRMFNAGLDLKTYTENGLQSVPIYSVMASKVKSDPVNFGLNIIGALEQVRADTDYYFSGVKLTLDLMNKPPSKAESLFDFVRQKVPAKLNTWRKKNTEIIIQYILNEISVNSSDLYDLNQLNELYQHEAFDAYRFAVLEGRESDNVRDIIDNIIAKRYRSSQLNKIENAALLAIGKARQLMLIIEDKFGSNRYEEIIDMLRTTNGVKAKKGPGGALSDVRGNVQVDNPDIVLLMLTKREKEITMIEYDNRVKRWASSAKNKCPHLSLIFKLRHSPSKAVTEEVYNQLESYFGKIPDNEWIMCNACNFRVMCPHYHEFMKIKDGPYDTICKKLFKYALKTDTTEDLSVYCKICGEKMYEISEDEPKNTIYGDFHSGLKNKIWALSMNILSSVQFSNPIDYRRFSNDVADAILPYIISAESANIKRKKTITANSLEDDYVDPITHLLMVIYIHAFILDAIASSNDEIGFNGAKRGSKISVFAEVMFKNIVSTNKGIIDQISNITIEYIKTHFSNAYKLLHQNNNLSYTVSNPEEELAIYTTTVDPTYRYMVRVAKYMGDLPNKLCSTPEEYRREFETVMGNSLPGIIAATKASMKDPIIAAIFLRKSNIEIPIGTSWSFLVKDPRLNLYAHMYERNGQHRHHPKKGGRSHAHAAHRPPATPHRPPATQSIQVVTPKDMVLVEIFETSYDLFVDYTKNIINQTMLDEYIIKLQKLKEFEQEWVSSRFVSHLKAYYSFYFKHGGQFAVKDIPITTLYGENGHRHKWNIYMYGVVGESTPPIEVANVVKARNDKIITEHNMLVDTKCNICGVLKSQINTLSVEQTTKELKINRDKTALFLFYKSRCPIGGVHEYSQKTSCIKCGITATSSDEYYKKYHDKFVDQKREISSAQNLLSGDAMRDNATQHINTKTRVVDATTFPKWEPNFTSIVDLAAFADTTTTIIEAIGSMDGRPYADIIKGLDIPAEPKNNLDPRLFATDAEVRLLLTNYNIFRNASKITNLKPHIAALLEPIPASDWATLMTMPDIKGDYYERFTYILQTDSAAMAYKFIIQSLCEKILLISKPIGPEWLDTLKMDFAKKEIASILKNQKMFSKHGNFNWSIFDMSNVEDVDDIDEAASEADTEKDFFSGDGIDYDVSENNPNNEPD